MSAFDGRGFLAGLDAPTRRFGHAVRKQLERLRGEVDAITSGSSTVDHGALLGLGDDDHSQYALSDGTRGNFEPTGTTATHTGAVDPHGDRAYADAEDAAHSVVDQAYADSAVSTHAGAVDPHGDRAYADGEDAAHSVVDQAYTDSSISTHVGATGAHASDKISYDGSGNSALIQAWLTATELHTAIGQVAGQLYTPTAEETEALIAALNALVIADPALDGISNPDLFTTDLLVARHIAAGSIITAKLDAQAVTAAKIATGTITALQIAADTITAAEIAAQTITTAELSADAIKSRLFSGTIGDAVTFTAATTASSATINGLGNIVYVGDVGKTVTIAGALAGGLLTTTITYADGTDFFDVALAPDNTSAGTTVNIKDYVGLTTQGTIFDLDRGSIHSPGLSLDGLTGDVLVSGDVQATSFSLWDTTSIVGELGQYVATDGANSSALYMRSRYAGMTDGLIGWTDDPTAPEVRAFFVGPHLSTNINDHARLVLTDALAQVVGPRDVAASDNVTTFAASSGDGTTYATRLEAYWGAYRTSDSTHMSLYIDDTGTFVKNAVIDADNFAVAATGNVSIGNQLILGYDGTELAPSLIFGSDTDTGIWRVGSGNMAFVSNGSRAFDINGDQVRFSDGTELAPSLTFISDPDTGVFLDAANSLGFATQGSEKAQLGTTHFNMAKAVTGAAALYVGGAGTQALPAFTFSGDTSTGMMRYAASAIGFVIGGNYSMIHNSSAIHTYYQNRTINGTAALPSYSFSSDTNTGIYWPSADEIALSVGGQYALLMRDDAQHVIRGGSVQDTTSGDGSDGVLFDCYDTSVARGKFAGIAFRARYGTDRHVLARVWQPGGDRLGFRNWENTAWVALDASAFTVSSSLKGKTRVRNARSEHGVLDIVVPEDRDLAYANLRAAETVLFDNKLDDDSLHMNTSWYCDDPDHVLSSDCLKADCPNEQRSVKSFHVCDQNDWCSGTNEAPCYDVSQHFDRVGLIAEQIETVWPKAVAKNVDDGSCIGINYDVVTVEIMNVVEHLIDHVEELQAQIDDLRKGRK